MQAFVMLHARMFHFFCTTVY